MSRIPGLDNGDNKKNSPTWKQEYLHTPIEEPKQLATEEELKMMSNKEYMVAEDEAELLYENTDGKKAHPRDLVVIDLMKSIYRTKKSGVGHSITEFNMNTKVDRIYLEECDYSDIVYFDEDSKTWMDGNKYVDKLFKKYNIERHTH